jgi:hypothetical protein
MSAFDPTLTTGALTDAVFWVLNSSSFPQDCCLLWTHLLWISLLCGWSHYTILTSTQDSPLGPPSCVMWFVKLSTKQGILGNPARNLLWFGCHLFNLNVPQGPLWLKPWSIGWHYWEAIEPLGSGTLWEVLRSLVTCSRRGCDTSVSLLLSVYWFKMAPFATTPAPAMMYHPQQRLNQWGCLTFFFF